MASRYLNPAYPGYPISPEEEKIRENAQRQGTPFINRVKGAAKGAATGLVLTKSPYGAFAGAGAGFVNPTLTGEKGSSGTQTLADVPAPGAPPAPPGGGGAGGSGGNGNGPLSDVRARIDELRRQQYDQRTQNLDKVMSFFGPVNQELKNIYGVDMPTWNGAGNAGAPPAAGPAAGPAGRFQNNYQLKEPFSGMGLLPKTPQYGAFDILPTQSPFAAPPPLNPDIKFSSRLRNPKAGAPTGSTAQGPREIAGNWQTKPRR